MSLRSWLRALQLALKPQPPKSNSRQAMSGCLNTNICREGHCGHKMKSRLRSGRRHPPPYRWMATTPCRSNAISTSPSPLGMTRTNPKCIAANAITAMVLLIRAANQCKSNLRYPATKQSTQGRTNLRPSSEPHAKVTSSMRRSPFGRERRLVLWNANIHLRFPGVQYCRRMRRCAWQESGGSQNLSPRELDRG